jgi:hypothetical protein
LVTYADDPEEDKPKTKQISENKQENLTFVDDPNPGVPSLEKTTDIKALTEEQRDDWTDSIKSTHEALIKKYSIARVCEIHVKQGYDEENDIDIWTTKKYKYHALTIGEKKQLNDLNASIADIEKQVYDRVDAIRLAAENTKDASKLRKKVLDIVREQTVSENKNMSYHDLVDRRVEYQAKAMWLYFRCPEEIYITSSVSDVALALDVAQFIENNPHPLGTGAGIS